MKHNVKRLMAAIVLAVTLALTSAQLMSLSAQAPHQSPLASDCNPGSCGGGG